MPLGEQRQFMAFAQVSQRFLDALDHHHGLLQNSLRQRQHMPQIVVANLGFGKIEILQLRLGPDVGEPRAADAGFT